MKTHTSGQWNMACDSYGKVQHSRKYDCVYTVINGDGGERIVTVAARIENPADARLIAAAKDVLAALRSIIPSFEARLTAKPKDVEAWDLLNAAKAAIAKVEGQ